MRITTLGLTLAGALVLAGCSTLISLNPIITEQQATFDPALLGAWNATEGDGIFVIKQDGAGYGIVYTEGKSVATKFDARMMRVGSAEILDLVIDDDDPFRIPAHLLARVWPGSSTLRWAFLDSDWLKEQAAKQLPSQKDGDRTLLTAPGPAVQAFLMLRGADERAYSKPQDLVKAQ